MLNRAAFSTAQRLAQGFPVLAITGPRQSGKTTLARALFALGDRAGDLGRDRVDEVTLPPSKAWTAVPPLCSWTNTNFHALILQEVYRL